MIPYYSWIFKDLGTLVISLYMENIMSLQIVSQMQYKALILISIKISIKMIYKYLH